MNDFVFMVGFQKQNSFGTNALLDDVSSAGTMLLA